MAIIMALAKDPELLLLDEPFANIDPLAKHEISKILMEIAAERALTILISSHILADLEQLCDHLIILAASQVKLADSIEHIMALHQLLVGPSDSFDVIAKSHTVIQASHTGRQSTVLLCADEAVTHPAWEQQDLALETIVLAYLAAGESSLPNLEPCDQSSPHHFRKRCSYDLADLATLSLDGRTRRSSSCDLDPAVRA
jgi:ABC-2 type transport system ATP-binding protein